MCDTHIEWGVVGCGSKNKHRKDIMCLKEMALCAQNMLTILGSIVNIIGGTYIWPCDEHKNLHFDDE